MKFYSALLNLIEFKNRQKFKLLLVFFLLSAFLQVVGIASIAPFITIISNPDIITSAEYWQYAYTSFEFTSTTSFLIAYAICVVVLLVISNGISSLTIWGLFRFSVKIGADIQQRIYNNYLSNDYSFFSEHNSNSLISEFTMEIPRFVYMVVQPLLHLISQLFIGFIIVVGLFVLDPIVAIIATTLIVAIYLFIFKIIRGKVVVYGRKIRHLNEQKVLLLDESIAGIKEVKLAGNEEYYKKELNNVTREGLYAAAYCSLAGDLPKFVVETIVFSAILCLSIYILLSKGTSGDALSFISLYALAGYKLLPAAQVIYKSISEIKANASVIFDINKELEQSKISIEPKQNKGCDSIGSGDITFDQVSYRYLKANINAISNCNFFIKEKSMVAFVGLSGAGKSTAVDILLGLLEPNAGKILIGNNAITLNNVRSWQNKIGYVPQNIFILDNNFVKNIAFGVPPQDICLKKVIDAAKKANLHDFISSCEGGYDFHVGERGAKLSGGQKQRVGIARALYKSPSVLIFDEATSALDTITEKQILTEIASLAKATTVIMIAHRLSTVINSDKIIVFDNGKVVGIGNYEELKTSNITFQSLIKAGEADPTNAVDIDN